MGVFQSLEERFKSAGPKRILALDGGGIRGAVSLGYLEKLEQILRKKHQNPQLLLSDYFDLIGGTSTGAIIAATLAIGKSVAEVKQQYLDLGADIFGDRKGFLGVSIHYKYDENYLKSALKNMFGDMTMGDEGTNGLKTGLCVVTKRMDTFSTWPITNHPDGKYYDRNKFLLRDIVRASTAAPTYFIPELLNVGNGITGTFVDGGMSMMNNPALQLFLIATVKGYPFQWKTGENNLQLVSIGTGRRDVILASKKYQNPHLLEVASMAPDQFMHDAQELTEMMLQYFSNSPTARHIDKHLGKMEDDLFHNSAALSYLRYNVILDKNNLNAMGITNLSDESIEDLTEMDDADNRFILAEIGEKAANVQMKEEHFGREFVVAEQ